MTNPHMSVATDDDLPRTLRRDKAEKAARDREAAERQRADAEQGPSFKRESDMPRILDRQAHDRQVHEPQPYDRATDRAGLNTPQIDNGPAYTGMPPYAHPMDEPQPAVVRALKIPFFHLMWFCLKLTLAAIPAIILLGAILYGLGQILKIYMPWLVQAEIFIRFPR